MHFWRPALFSRRVCSELRCLRLDVQAKYNKDVAARENKCCTCGRKFGTETEHRQLIAIQVPAAHVCSAAANVP